MCTWKFSPDTHKGMSKGTRKQGGSGSVYSDICSVPETDGEPIRPPGTSATLRLPCTSPKPASWLT